MRRTACSPEPNTITAAYVATWLEDRGRHESAAFVRFLADSSSHANLREQRLREDIQKLRDRLDRYEPPAAPPQVVSYKPSPRASD